MSRDIHYLAPRPRCLEGLLVHAVGPTDSLASLCSVPWHAASGMRMIIEPHKTGHRTLWFTEEDVDCMACIAAETK